MTEHKDSRRIRLNLSRGWSFAKKRMGRWWYRAEDVPDEEPVDLPHCWNAADDFQPGLEYYRGYGSYRKDFLIPSELRAAEDVVWSLESEGFYGTGTVWLNGGKLADVDGQYLGFSLETGDNLQKDSRNILSVRLTNNCRSYVLPGNRMPDFLLYGGLSGRVWLQGTPSLSLDLRATRISCGRVSRKEAGIEISFVVSNKSGHSRWCRADWTIMDDKGREILKVDPVELNLAGHEKSCEIVLREVLMEPALWSPEAPALYRAVCRLSEDGRVVDSESIRFGVRDAVFMPDRGFFLNGERVELRGCNRHECMPGFGRAVFPALHFEDARMMKEMGLNFVRLSHYPQHPDFLNACDELGIMVYAEIATWKSVRAGWWLRYACRQMTDMIRRDRNHPCVILWGMGNESRSRRAYMRLGRIARSLDPARPVTYAENHFYRAERQKTTDLSDVWGLNYDFEALDDGYRASRLKSVVVTECSNYPGTLRGDMAEELKQVSIIEQDLARIRSRPYIAGFALWCWNDYGTLRKDRYRRYSGIVDAWRLPKMSAALLKAMLLKEPFVAIYGDWGRKAGLVRREIHVFTNCERIVLSVKGRDLTAAAGRTHAVLAVDFEDAALLVTGSMAGRTVQDSLVPFGAAKRISVRAGGSACVAGAEGVVSVLIDILDEAGGKVSDWKGDVRLAVEGTARVISYSGNGVIMVSGGSGRGFVHVDGPGAVVTASSQGLAQGSVSLGHSSVTAS